MSVLLLRLAGPMQSWGIQSRFSVRDTGLEPSKSGVIGMLCAALGRTRYEPVADLANLRMAVRVDREGRICRDFHTAMNVLKADGSGTGTVTSSRYFLANAEFVVGLEGDRTLLASLDAALAAPRWPLYLGRKAFVPSLPLRIGGPLEGDLLTVLAKGVPWRKRSPGDKPGEVKLRLVIETPFGTADEVRYDVPVSFAARTFTMRHVKTEFIDSNAILLEDDPCCI